MADYYTHFSFAIPKISAKEERWIRSKLKNVPNEDWDFNWDVDGDGLWIYSEGWSVPEQAADFVQRFLKKFRNKDFVAFEFAHTCSKPRLDAYGGGGVFITAKEQKWYSSSSWISTQEAKWNNKNLDE